MEKNLCKNENVEVAKEVLTKLETKNEKESK